MGDLSRMFSDTLPFAQQQKREWGHGDVGYWMLVFFSQENAGWKMVATGMTEVANFKRDEHIDRCGSKRGSFRENGMF